MKFISWNVNGLRACMNKGFLDAFYSLNADFFCLQETKLQAGQIDLDLPGYEQYWCYAEKKGYSGTAVFTKHTPQSVSYGLGIPELDTEGRLITLEYPEFYLIACYTPNAQRGLARIEHRLKWEEAFRCYLKELDAKKPVILCGDLNVAHNEIDLKNPASNRGNAGFSDEEREAFSKLLDSGFTDTFRHLYPEKVGAYSWWSYMFNARANNAGWRIDYFVVSDRLSEAIHDATIHPEYFGSDHCPVGLDLNITCNGGIWSPETEHPADKEKEAGRASPAGHLIKTSTALALILAILILPLTLIKTNSEPPATEPQGTKNWPPAIRLIETATDRTHTASHTFSTGTPYSSYLSEYIIDGTDRCELVHKKLLYSTQAGDIVLFPNTYNYFLRIDFAKIISTAPELNVVVDCTGEATVMSACYYDTQNYIDGCFIYGYASNPLNLIVKVSYSELTDQTDVIQIIPYFPTETDEVTP